MIRYQADHTLLLALPAFAPALVVVGVVVYIAMRDRRRPPDDDPPQDDAQDEGADVSGEDGSP
ncbi:hypothetical protein P3H80_31960 [Mycolicibacterium septicum]|uniref:hypothetical protein n=1 Tax=Mycolicibacterium septicum TaxID=98668 RepID=UPI0023E1D676|nr:hypothetical protein [Mycolicibacterium septicum]MDF3342075.1 hypothetical protein [Mycolicibacterium septicum]